MRDSYVNINIYITEDELNYINEYINSINSVNATNSPTISSVEIQHINWVQALAYSRISYTSDGDFERTQR